MSKQIDICSFKSDSSNNDSNPGAQQNRQRKQPRPTRPSIQSQLPQNTIHHLLYSNTIMVKDYNNSSSTQDVEMASPLLPILSAQEDKQKQQQQAKEDEDSKTRSDKNKKSESWLFFSVAYVSLFTLTFWYCMSCRKSLKSFATSIIPSGW